MSDPGLGHFRVPEPYNEPILSYAPGTPERARLKARLADLTDAGTEIPMVIGGRHVAGNGKDVVRSPHRKELVIGTYAVGGRTDVGAAIDAAVAAQAGWAATPFVDRAAIFLRAAGLLAGPYRDTVNA